MQFIISIFLALFSSSTAYAQQQFQILDLLHDQHVSMQITGEEPYDKIGLSVASGDINGDGFSDMVIGANEAAYRRGSVYVILGNAGLRSNHLLDLSSPSIPVVEITGEEFGDEFANWVVCCDMDGDGYDDLILPALYGDTVYGQNTGKAYILRGSASFPRDGSFAVNTYTGGIVTIHGAYQEGTLGFIDSWGDIDGDGCADVILKSHLADPLGRHDAGMTYVVFGKPVFFDRDDIFLADWDNDGVLAIFGRGSHVHNGYTNHETTGWSTGAGDMNGDGYDDIVIGSHNADPFGNTTAGTVYVIPGSPVLARTKRIDLLVPSVPILEIYGENSGDNAGNIVFTGDLDGDGYDDLAINALYGDSFMATDTGKIYVLFGSESFFSQGNISLADTDRPMITLAGFRSGDGLGPATFSDLNGDGHLDLFAGMPFFDYLSMFDDRNGSGAATILFGGPNVRQYGNVYVHDPHLLYVTSAHENDTFGFRVASGDFNGDSIDDVLVGAHSASPNGKTWAGACYVIWGNTSWEMPDEHNIPVIVESSAPPVFSLNDNYPNPFNPVTTLSFTISDPSMVTLTVFDILGRAVETLIRETLTAGEHSCVWDGSSYASGVYFYRLETDSQIVTKRMTLIK